jgi:hypothetical protein
MRFWNNFHPIYSKSKDRITYDVSRYIVKHINITVLVTYTIHISLKDYFVSKLALYKVLFSVLFYYKTDL